MTSGGAGRLLAAVALVLLAGCTSGAPTPAAPPTVDSPAVDPLSAVDDPGRRADLLHQLAALPRYEETGRLLAADPVPLDEQVAIDTGRQALRTSQLTAQVHDRSRFPQPLGFDTDAYRAELEAAARGSSLRLAAVSRNPDAARTLLLDPDFRRSLLVTPHVDQAGAVALLERATRRVVPVEGTGPAAEQAAFDDAKQNAQIAAAVLTDVAQDPFGWRAAIGKGTPISDAITGIAVDNIDAFADDVGMKAVAFPTPARLDEGFYGGFWLGRWDARNVLMFVGADRTADGPDADLVRMHMAARQHKRLRVMQAAAGDWPPYTALDVSARVDGAVDAADFRTAFHVDDAPAAGRSLLDNGSLAGQIAERTVPTAAPPWPGVTDGGTSIVVDRAIAGYAPGETIGLQGIDLKRTVLDRHRLDTDRVVAGTLGQAGGLPADQDVADWADAVRVYHDTLEQELLVLDEYSPPKPRTPLKSGEVDRLRGRDRIPWGFL